MRVAVAPLVVGIFEVGEKENVLSEGSPVTDKVWAGIVPVDPETRVSVIVYVTLVPLRAVRLGVIVML